MGWNKNAIPLSAKGNPPVRAEKSRETAIKPETICPGNLKIRKTGV